MILAPYGPEAKRGRRILILCESQDSRCCYCGIRVRHNQGDPGWDCPSIDHVKPLAHCGKREWENEVMACRLCNTGRDRMNPKVYLARVIDMGRWQAFRWATKMRARHARSRDRIINEARPQHPQAQAAQDGAARA